MKRENSSVPYQEYQYTINIIQVPDSSANGEEEFIDPEIPDPTAYENRDIASELQEKALNTVYSFVPDNFTVFCYNQSYWKWSTYSDEIGNSTPSKWDWTEVGNLTNCSGSDIISTAISSDSFVKSSFTHVNWWGLVAILVVLITTVGNVLVILAISWDRRLQNMTNYFLLSLAATDLMVAIFVMPIAIVVLVLGRFPFSSEFCLVWISFDVLFCSASIMHLCTISVDRFLSLRYPMKFGRHKTRKRVVLKLILVWCLSLATSMPLSLMYAADTRPTIVDGVCQIPVSLFQIIGSLFSFYVPLVIMLVTYALTVRLLSQKESELMASAGVDNPIIPLSHSVRLKRLLCKTTSTLSSTTATSIADTEISETVPSEDVESEATNSPGRRGTPYARYSPHYSASGMKGHRNYSVRDSKTLSGGASLNPRTQFECHLRPPLTSASSVELSVYPKYNQDERLSPLSYSGSPKKRYKKVPSNGLRNHTAKTSKVNFSSKSSQKDRFEKGRCDKGHSVEIRISDVKRDRESSLQEVCETEGLNGTPVNVPCACAPRFFLEGLSTTDPSNEGCEDCSQFEGLNVDGFSCDHSGKATSRKRPLIASFVALLTVCRKPKGDTDSGLDSPWHEGGRSSPCNPCNSDASFIPNARTTLFHRSPGDPPVASITAPSSNVSAGGGNHSGGASSTIMSSNRRSTWRTRSCTASMRFVSSKRHGRNIRMEQKATKVLGIVFFTFVILWAPFFIINLLLGVCPSCIHEIGEDVINFVTWLGYISSMVNPFFYTFFNKSFRDAFVKIIKCNLRNRRKYHF